MSVNIAIKNIFYDLFMILVIQKTIMILYILIEKLLNVLPCYCIRKKISFECNSIENPYTYTVIRFLIS